jgi:predicted DsbA family dithiol-disulfide isomerase
VPRTERHERIRPAFEARGLAYDPPLTIPNTQRALRVTEYARDLGLHDAVHDRLMNAYWAEGRDIGDVDVLRELAAEAGVDDIREALSNDSYRVRVQVSTEQAQQIGINGIPAFLLDGRLLVLGAQPLEVFEKAFDTLAS